MITPIPPAVRRQVEDLERASHGRYAGWCIDGGGTPAVDIARRDGTGFDRYRGATLRQALRLAREAVELGDQPITAAPEEEVSEA